MDAGNDSTMADGGDIDMNIELEMTMQNQSWIIERDDGSMSAACFSRTHSSHYSHSITLTPSIVM